MNLHSPSKSQVIKGILIFSILFVLNWIGRKTDYRIDFTQNKRFTLSEAAKSEAEALKTPVIIDVFLDGDLPAEFRKLKAETEQILREYARLNSNIKYNFVDPLEDEDQRDANATALQQLGLTPVSITVEEGSRVSQEILFPWALANKGDQTVKIQLLKNKLGATSEERVNNSVQQLEYVFADAFKKLQIEEKKKIAVLKGNGEMNDLYMADFLQQLREYYQIAPFTLDSVSVDPQGTLDQLSQFDLAIIAKPTQAFSESEKFVLDQYTMQGGNSMWLIDNTLMELDSLLSNNGKTIAIPRDLNLNDLLFKYGLRINANIIADLYFTQIVLATGNGRDAQYNPAPWVYAPMVLSKNDHPVNNNIEGVRFRFANEIDTLPNQVKKSILLRSSPLSKTIGVPVEIDLEIVNQQPDKNSFTNGNKPLAVLLEGTFPSAFTNRIAPFSLPDKKEESAEARMIVISDGDIIRNDLQNGRPLELGYDKWTGNFYGNKEFLLNCVNYLLDDNGLINIRSKEVELAFLDRQRTFEEKNKWQLVNTGVPIVLLLLFGWIFNRLRSRKYSR